MLTVCSAVAVLPDSAVFGITSNVPVYGVVKTTAGAVGVLVFLLIRNTRLAETLDALNSGITYLQSQQVKLLTADGLSRNLIMLDIRRELADRQAKLHREVFEGIEQLSIPGRPGGDQR